MQNQHPIDPSPCVTLGKGMVGDAAPSTSALLHRALLNEQLLWTEPARELCLPLSFPRCAGL